ncbi:unnamed protein product [Calypogeia fissa]
MDEASTSSAQHQNGASRAEAGSSSSSQQELGVMSGRVEEMMTQYPSADQPEMMRAAEKDDHYVSQLCEACYDAFRSTFGTRLAVVYQNELSLAGRVLYYLLTTGAGLQTLGEEYCDIVQVGGPSGLPPSPARRLTLVFYQAVLPYLANRVSARAAARGHLLVAERDEEDNQESEQGTIGEEAESARQEWRERRSSDGASTSTTPSWTARLRQRWNAALRRWPVLLPSVRDAMVLILRTHLMVYYFEGLYYHIGKRAAGIRYVYTGKPSQQRPRYHILGLFLFFQLSFVYGDWLTRTCLPAVASSMRSRVTAPSFRPAGARGILVLDEDGVEVPDKSTTRSSSSWTDSEGPGSSKCPLCLSPRQDPTATPCGHVFCWTCVAEWCNEKPECPLCRSPVKHPDLVCLYHANF